MPYPHGVRGMHTVTVHVGDGPRRPRGPATGRNCHHPRHMGRAQRRSLAPPRLADMEPSTDRGA
jgi:hypothetical protein